MTHREGCMGGCCGHASDCAVHNEPAMPRGLCDCGHRERQCAEHDRKVRRHNRWVRVYNLWVRHGHIVFLVFLAALAVALVMKVYYSGG